MNRSEAGKLGWLKNQELFEKKWAAIKSAYDLKPKQCKNCDKPIPYKQRQNSYCTQTCAAISNNKKRYENLQKRVKFCEGCSDFKYKRKDTKYCIECISNKKHINYSKNLNDCKKDATRRKFLIKMYGNHCWVCNNTTWNNKPIPLELDHIDGDSNNNTKENLRVICPNCHAQTETYKGKNKGRGREKRRLIYNAGAAQINANS